MRAVCIVRLGFGGFRHAFEELGERHAEPAGDLAQVDERDVALAYLDGSKVRAIEVDSVRKLLLAYALYSSQLFDA